ncbi:MAG: sterol desaturase family protein [Moraxellaceae bacterium]
MIFFPAWLIVVYSLSLVLPAWWLLGQLVSANAGALFAAALLAGYLAYEFFHACEHLPPGHPLSRLPGIRQMRVHHERHHRRTRMQTHNFNIVFPLQDCLRGTRWGEPPAG